MSQERPVIVIKGGARPLTDQMKEIWAFRELLYFLVWRDIKVRYKQTFFGVAWAILQPLLMMLLFSLVLGRVMRISDVGVPYPIFVLSGLVPWTFFAQSWAAAGESLVGSANLVSKIYFPRILLPVAAGSSFVMDLLVASAVLVLFVVIRIGGHWDLLLLPLAGVPMFLASLGLGVWTGALNARYRDLHYAVPFAVQVLFFATPVVYPIGILPEAWEWLLALNPAYWAIECFRAVALPVDMVWSQLVLGSCATSLAILVSGVLYFQRTQRTLADVI